MFRCSVILWTLLGNSTPGGFWLNDIQKCWTELSCTWKGTPGNNLCSEKMASWFIGIHFLHVILVPDYSCLDLLPLFGCIVFPLIFLPTSYAHIHLDSYHHLPTRIFIPCTYISLSVYRIIYSVSFCWSPSWAVLSTPLGRFPLFFEIAPPL